MARSSRNVRSAGVTWSRYDGLNGLYLVSRRETLTDAAVGVSWNLGGGFTLRPQLAYITNSSNAELYAYNKADASLNLRFDF